MPRLQETKIISKEAREACGRCWRDFACLEGDGEPMCKGCRRITNEYLFVKNGRFPGCPNHIAFGTDSHVCCCAIRNELYRKYNI